MTRVLADLLDIHEPGFRLGLSRLEQASGAPAHDIRLTSEIQRLAKEKLLLLGLDPHDTTPEELYHALGERLKADEQLLQQVLHIDSDVTTLEHIARSLSELPVPKRSFALKNTVARKLLAANAPKKTAKALGYRSLDSMLKHESVGGLYAAAWLVESEAWRKRLVSSYAKLQATDFERRDVVVEHPQSERWQRLGESVIADKRHHVLAFKELASVVLLPLPQERPPLTTMTTFVLAVHAMNDVYASGMYLQLHQVKGSFGQEVQRVVTGTPSIASEVLDREIPWHIVQRYYARFGHMIKTALFEPHVQLEDIVWYPVESVLGALDPGFKFWKHTAHVGLAQGSKVVSCNITDALLSHCNNLPFNARISNYFHESLWHELVLRYMNHDKLEQGIAVGLAGTERAALDAIPMEVKS